MVSGRVTLQLGSPKVRSHRPQLSGSLGPRVKSIVPVLRHLLGVSMQRNPVWLYRFHMPARGQPLAQCSNFSVGTIDATSLLSHWLGAH